MTHRRRLLGLSAALSLLAGMVAADTLRVATFAAPLSRDGPGLLLRDLRREDAQIEAVLGVLTETRPDILLLTNFDYDYDARALQAFAARAGYAYWFATEPNTGQMTPLDLDQNGKLGEPRDAQGYGRFRGDGGMAIVARWPLRMVADYSDLLWRDAPWAPTPTDWPDDVLAVQKLSHAGHWVIEVAAPDGPLHLLAFAATAPVFDGPEDRNGLRNAGEIGVWTALLDGAFGPVPDDLVILGNANLDPSDGDGRRDAIAALLGHPKLVDPMPQSAGAVVAADPQHVGNPALDTADWSDEGPGNLRVSYVLPGLSWQITDAGVFWPAPQDPVADVLGHDGLAAGPHRLVWVDIRR